ncbi:Sulfotransferase domain protein [Methyloligella halotolerans]|uniref:Sulfotransferase domain protein n=1 Tax=Methyloligella halotolerans TaxID=1177755 RepID=A0A1E2S2N0_9HYPH|nr:sulfotransferase domain-containing protein [Methyloligella halotolerans]ODA68672.1 Sulfotransferase domain protein [Methyloligella halotolerans]
MSWLIANGAPKSGSTWIFQLLQSTGAYAPLPGELQDPDWVNPSVAEAKLDRAVELLGMSSERYATKQHWPTPLPLSTGTGLKGSALIRRARQLKRRLANKQKMRRYARLLPEPGVQVCNIIRDVRDVAVSLYHHEQRRAECDQDISTFLARHGRELVTNTIAYHRYWIGSPLRTRDNYFITSYEFLIDDVEAAADQLFDFAGLAADPEMRSRAIEKGSFESKKVKGPGEFFRKGQAMAFADEISASEAERLLTLAERGGLLGVKRAIADFNPILKPYLEMTDIGL